MRVKETEKKTTKQIILGPKMVHMGTRLIPDRLNNFNKSQ